MGSSSYKFWVKLLLTNENDWPVMMTQSNQPWLFFVFTGIVESKLELDE